MTVLPASLATASLAFLLGLSVGSFVAAAAIRIPCGTTLWGRSACPHCGSSLGVADLVPVLSWLVLRGRCRHCHAPVPGRYTLVELATGCLWLGCSLCLPDPVWGLTLALLGTILLLAGLIDLDHLYLPDPLMLAAALLVLLPWTAGLSSPVQGLAGAGLFGGLALLLRCIASWRAGREAMGLGDVKLMTVAGLWLGPWLLAPFLFLAGTMGIGLALLRQRSGPDRGPEVPFGPALALALLILLFLVIRQWPPLASISGPL
ncbi:prepilin peptidase [Oleisolibacter albus]|uniref:prepilin peptidase n=1 Tax=Oleisolibacter albus TaxID=2171757 RepID=UPI0019604D74|nr:A24 family peptidase [Oleisolibacter albus]